MNILLIQLKRIGDLILTTPAISTVRQKFPDATIWLVVSSGTSELLPAIGNVDQKFVVTNPRAWIDISRQKFDYCVDFTRNDRSSFLTRLSRAKKRIAVERRKQKQTFRSRAYNTLVWAPLRQLHTIDYHLKLLEPLGISGGSMPISLDLPQPARMRATELMARHRIRDQFIVFHPGSARPEKFWEADRWVEVVQHISNNPRLSPVLSGSASPLEQHHIGLLKSQLRSPIADLSGETDLLTLAALISRSRLLVTVDSAPMHFAAAAHVPQVALFGPTNPFHWRPRYDSALILQGKSEAPMTQFSPDQSPAPMKQISTRAVIGAMDALLSTPMAKGS